MILAGDIGGTKARLGLFEAASDRPQPVFVRTFTTLDYPDLNALLTALLDEREARPTDVSAACFGVAGPVVGRSARLTNAPWSVDADRIASRLSAPVTLVNDLAAMASAIRVLRKDERHVLQEGVPEPEGNQAIIAAGTGLGQAMLHHVSGRFVASASEAGHADWAPRTEREIEVLRRLTSRFGRAEVERVVSGSGLLNLHRVTHAGSCQAASSDDPAAVSAAALDGRCPDCAEALGLFVDAYGAEAGNLALRTMATGGLFVGGGIAPKILPALDDGRFMQAFRAKAPFDGFMSRIPVTVILHPDAGLLGAAVRAADDASA